MIGQKFDQIWSQKPHVADFSGWGYNCCHRIVCSRGVEEEMRLGKKKSWSGDHGNYGRDEEGPFASSARGRCQMVLP